MCDYHYPHEGYITTVTDALNAAGVPANQESLYASGSALIHVEEIAGAAVYGDNAGLKLLWDNQLGWAWKWMSKSGPLYGTIALRIAPMATPREVAAAVKEVLAAPPVIDFTVPVEGGPVTLEEVRAAYPATCEHGVREGVPA